MAHGWVGSFLIPSTISEHPRKNSDFLWSHSSRVSLAVRFARNDTPVSVAQSKMLAIDVVLIVAKRITCLGEEQLVDCDISLQHDMRPSILW